MKPSIGPIGLDYIACAARATGVETDIVDLCFADDPTKKLTDYFSKNSPELVGISVRNSDDCFWPSGEWFIPDLADTVSLIKSMSNAPIALGGVGFSIFAEQILKYTKADFGIHGDGEQAIISLMDQLRGGKKFELVEGLLWKDNGGINRNKAAWPEKLSLPITRDAIDNKRYFNEGGQGGLETKRGCNRLCIYCADPLAKGRLARLRSPVEVANEAQNLLSQGIDVLHFCDAEFNIPKKHALEVCEEFARRKIGERLKWYTYMAVVPFDAELAQAMPKAGCVGINFTGDSASRVMLETYRQKHRREDIASAVKLCHKNDIKVMIDLLLGGPGETAETVKETIDLVKKIEPDCAGAALGIRIYPGTEMAKFVEQCEMTNSGAIRRHYEGELDFFKPTFYISDKLGDNPAELVRDMIGSDERFFVPIPERTSTTGNEDGATDHNYNDNVELVEAIAQGARGAYWDILFQLRTGK
jgi:radical SAM superfamily enzyme YgiQ (UPF0313 family)